MRVTPIGIAALLLLATPACSLNDAATSPVDAGESSSDAADVPHEDPASPDPHPLDAGGDGQKTLPPLKWTTKNPRGGDAPVLTHASYDYAPSVMHDGVYRMWWCGGIAGDHVLYAEATTLNGPWHAHGSATPSSFDDVFQPTGDATGFDGEQTCDPSVVRVSGVYYLYYGGLAKRGAPVRTTQIGVARSDDGMTWMRLNAGLPIITVARDYKTAKVPYGAGQPSVVYKDGKFWLIYTDTTGVGGNQVNGAGQYVLRSTDPTFQTSVEELTATGFASRASVVHTGYSLLGAFSVDWQYSDALDTFLVAADGPTGKSTIHVFDANLKALTGPAIEVTGHWSDGPGIASRPDKHALPAPDAACDVVPIDLMRGMSNTPLFAGAPNTWELAHDGIDVVVNRTCADVPLPRIYDGSRITATARPLAVVAGGRRLQFAVAAPATRIARSSYPVTAAIYDAIPFGASMQQGAQVLGAPARPAAFHLDDKRLWPVDCAEVITDNGSSITTTTATAWDAIPVATALRCLK